MYQLIQKVHLKKTLHHPNPHILARSSSKTVQETWKHNIINIRKMKSTIKSEDHNKTMVNFCSADRLGPAASPETRTAVA